MMSNRPAIDRFLVDTEAAVIKEIESLICVIMDKCDDEANADAGNVTFAYEWSRCLEDLFCVLLDMLDGVHDRLCAAVDDAIKKEREMRK